jgi:YD repeat-containing protein
VESVGIFEEWTHDTANRRTGAARANYVSDSFWYDADDRLLGIESEPPYPCAPPYACDPEPLQSWEYRYDAEGNRLSARDILTTNRSEHCVS